MHANVYCISLTYIVPSKVIIYILPLKKGHDIQQNVDFEHPSTFFRTETYVKSFLILF